MTDSTVRLDEPRKLYIDNNEPIVIKRFLAPIKDVNFEWGAYNIKDHSDYWWKRTDGTTKEVERKTWGEVLTNVEKVEEQMSRHLSRMPKAEHVLLLEGIATSKNNSISTYNFVDNKWYENRQYKQNLAGIYSWLYQISHYVTIIPSYNIATTAAAIAGMYKSDGKTDHSTLNRHYHIRTFNRDPVIERYMAIFDGIGESKAEILRSTFPTIQSLVLADRNDFIVLPGFGPALADKIMRQLGTFSQPKVRNVK